MNYESFKKQYEQAGRIAEQAHENQKYDKEPYSVHLNHVQRVLNQFGYGIGSEQEFTYEKAVILISAWLHDTLEDTVLEKKHIEYHFGEQVADVVWRVTDEAGKNRAVRKKATYPKIKASKLAIIVKLADRIANTEAALSLQKKKGVEKFYQMYKKEWQEFHEQLYSFDEEIEPMWQYLKTLSV